MSADDGRSITLVWTLGGVECWRSKEFTLLYCDRCEGRGRPVAFVDAKITDDVLREVAEWHMGKFHGGQPTQSPSSL